MECRSSYKGGPGISSQSLVPPKISVTIPWGSYMYREEGDLLRCPPKIIPKFHQWLEQIQKGHLCSCFIASLESSLNSNSKYSLGIDCSASYTSTSKVPQNKPRSTSISFSKNSGGNISQTL